MTSTAPHKNRRGARLSLGALSLTTLVLAALAAASTVSAGPPPNAATASWSASYVSRRSHPRPAYGWPVRPFHRQHPVRGFFGDPRIAGKVHAFHFGVDVSAPDGTAVYATMTGRAYVRASTVTIRNGGPTAFHYWHVVPTVRTGQRVCAYRTVIGHIEKTWIHVHFAESYRGRYVNPLRPGAMGPFVDDTTPLVQGMGVSDRGGGFADSPLSGRVDLSVVAADTTPLAVPAPWGDKPVSPALVRWRLRGPRGLVVAWRPAADFRLHIPNNADYDRYYAPETRQNKVYPPSKRKKEWTSRAGQYAFVLRTSWNTRAVADGAYRLEVMVTDTCGNRTTAATELVVANGV